MFPSETEILMAIALNKSSERLMNRPMDVTGEYVGYLCDSLVSRGHLKRSGTREYQITAKGREALYDFQYSNRTRIENAIKALQQLGIEINQRADKLEKEAIKVN